jgi:hypothetical protein
MTAKMHTGGYQFVILHANGKREQCYVHRLVAAALIPNYATKPQVNHIDGDKANNCVGNLEWSTGAENMRHALDTGLRTYAKGDKWHSAKLTAEQVQAIRSAYRRGKNSAELAQQYGVVRETINGIGNRRKRLEVPCAMDCKCSACKVGA